MAMFFCDFMRSLCCRPRIILAPLCLPARHTGSGDWRTKVTDLIVVVLSAGGILLMAGYAVLCDKI
jgi:hypothetical protein